MGKDNIHRKRFTLILRVSALLIIAAGMMRAIIVFLEARGEIELITLGLIVWSWLPYLVCLLLAVGKINPIVPLSGAILPLIMDLFMDYSVFIHPTSSTAAIGLLFMPLWNLVLFMPLGLLAGFLIVRLKKRYT